MAGMSGNNDDFSKNNQLFKVKCKMKIVNSLKIENCKFIIALISGYIGLSVSNFFGFSTVPVALLFFLFPAFALTYETQT